ncbi:tetratricopeptide repeat protein [Nonomuraea sp. SYSU D8015]|uniref:tetratricopeptide repeat protein n=1 Tax=Nonomuraea sp. SYSU D8015 TaxID=2593644 RepID=UPI0016609806|nr:tetratricopeptide repeat protein [Nonomuraea sp. SYSU D8015]
MRAFRTEDRDRFFGRDEEAHEIRKLWQSQRLTVLYGASGIGKTSLLEAGVMPLLSPHKVDVLPLGRVSYGSAFPRAAIPLHNPYVLALLVSWSPQIPPNRRADMTISEFLRARPVKRDAYGDPLPTLVAIDQVEELFASGRQRQLHRDWFFDQLADALRADQGLRLLLSIRTDRLMDLLPYEWELGNVDRPDLTDLTDEQEPTGTEWERVPLEALGFDSALEALRGPIEGTGLTFAEGAAEQVVHDLIRVRTRTESRQLVQGVEPAHLQVVGESLWRSLPPETTVITRRDVHQHAERALSEHYDREIKQIAAERFDGDDRRLRTWLRLTFGDRKPVRRGAIKTAGIGRTVIALLVKRRILSADQRMGEGSYALAYDRLLQSSQHDIGRVDATRRRLRPEDLLREAEGALGEGDLLQATKLAEEALVRSEGNDLHVRAQAESLLGNVAYEHGEVEKALAHYSAAAKSYETGGAPAAVGLMLMAMGRLRLAQGSPAEAVRDLRAAMMRVPTDLTIQTELAWALWYGGHPDAAVGVLNGVLDKEGNNVGALLGRGQMLAGMGGRDEAEAALRDLERAEPLRWPFAKVAHALALARTDRVDEAQQEMVEALAEAVDHGPLLLYAARVEHLAGKFTSATGLARRAISAKEPALPGHLARPARELAAL